jgi:hypothetical protein
MTPTDIRAIAALVTGLVYNHLLQREHSRSVVIAAWSDRPSIDPAPRRHQIALNNLRVSFKLLLSAGPVTLPGERSSKTRKRLRASR